MRRTILLGSVVAFLAVGLVACGSTKPGGSHSTEARFLSSCTFSHRAPDDPIVSPGVPGGAHSHDFLGNVTTNHSSTHGSLVGAATTCAPSGDSAAYWVPTLSVNGQPVPPAHATFYYRGNSKDFFLVGAFPPGFKLIAGTASATSPQPKSVTSWKCSNVDGSFSEIPSCPAGERLRLSINFPECWDGVNIDSADHKSHMSYRVQGRCPASHPWILPKIQFSISYPTTGGPTAALASGGQYSAHGDFFNAWDQGLLMSRVQTCINAGVKCTANGQVQI
jgi:hypothetical protein